LIRVSEFESNLKKIIKKASSSYAVIMIWFGVILIWKNAPSMWKGVKNSVMFLFTLVKFVLHAEMQDILPSPTQMLVPWCLISNDPSELLQKETLQL
jgi:hypothetical protein